MRRWIILGGLVLGFALPSTAPAQSVPSCGIGKFPATGDPLSDGVYFSWVKRRDGISCAAARDARSSIVRSF